MRAEIRGGTRVSEVRSTYKVHPCETGVSIAAFAALYSVLYIEGLEVPERGPQ